MRRLPVALAVTGALSLAAPAAATAQDATVQAVDAGNVWSPADVAIKVGDTVTWDFNGTAVPHNVQSSSPNWTFDSPFHTGSGTETFTFTAAGVYRFLCEVHPTTMTGSVTVTDESGNPPPDPDPEPEPGPGETHWPNDTPPLASFEAGGGLDRERPRLRGLRFRHRGPGTRIGFRVDERARVTVRVGLYGIPLKMKRVEVAEGREWVRIRGLRRGRYLVRVHAVDPAGNRSRTLARNVRLR